MEANIKAERVTPTEVMQLIEKRIDPFGDKKIPEDAGFSKTQIVQIWIDSFMERFEKFLTENKPGHEFDRKRFRSSLESTFGEMVADPEEGIEELERTVDE